MYENNSAFFHQYISVLEHGITTEEVVPVKSAALSSPSYTIIAINLSIGYMSIFHSAFFGPK